MPEITVEQLELIKQYEEYDLDELYNLIGNLAAEYGNPEAQSIYVLGLPNVWERGKQIVGDVRSAICRARGELQGIAVAKDEALQSAKWATVIIDVTLAVTVTAGIPPFAIAVALGKLTNRTISKLCD